MFKKLAFAAVFLCLSITASAQTKDVVRVFDSMTVEEGTAIDDAVIVFGDLNVRGDVKGSVVIIGGDLNVSSVGRVLGDTVVIHGKLHKEPGAEVIGKTMELSLGKFWEGDYPRVRSCAMPILGILTVSAISLFALVGFLAIFLLVAVLFTDKVGRTSYDIELHPWKAIYHGLIITVLVIPVTIFLVISIIGIPIVPFLFIALSAATLFGYAAVCQLIGLKFFKAIRKPGKPMLLEVVVGFVILSVVSLIPVVGWMIKFAAWLAGLGSTVSTRFGTRK